MDPAHRPPRDHREQLDLLRQRFAELGEVASRFLEGLLKKQRCGKHQAQRVLLLLHAYHRARRRRRDGAGRALSRLLAVVAGADSRHAGHAETVLAVDQPAAAGNAPGAERQRSPIEPRSTAEYQYLLFQETRLR